MAKKRAENPIAALSNGIVQAFERRRDTGGPYPAPFRDIAREASPVASEADLRVALTKAPLKSRCVLAFDGDLDSLAALKEDIAKLAEDERVLKSLCEKLCSKDSPTITLNKLKAKLKKPLNAAFQTHWIERLGRNDCPELIKVIRTGQRGENTNPQIHFTKYPIPLVLHEQILQAFEELRTANRYPCTLRDLIEKCGLQVTGQNLLAAFAKAPLKTRCVLAFNDDLDSLAVLQEDIAKLAGDDRVLKTLCERLCSPQLPLFAIKTASVLLATALKKPFLATWEQRLSTGKVPSFVEIVRLPGRTARAATTIKLRDTRFHLPWVSMSRGLVEALRRRNQAGDPLASWDTLVGDVSGADDKEALQMASTSEPFRSEAVQVFAKEPNGWLCLASDAARCAANPRVFGRVYTTALKKGDTGVELATLQKQKLLSPQLTSSFASYVKQLVATPPAGFGVVRLGTKSILFRLSDTLANTSSANETASQAITRPPQSQADPAAFARDFEVAFTKLDVAGGRFNFVKLADLREALPGYSRSTFDLLLTELRKNRRYSLSTSEGNQIVLTDRERAAAVVESGSHLVYCSQVR